MPPDSPNWDDLSRNRRPDLAFGDIEEERPTIAFGLSLAGALLIFVNGAYLMILGSAASSLGFFEAGAILGGLGFLGVLFGFILLVLAILLYRNPDSHTGYGITILLLSIVSIFGGGGFILGLILGVVGGILAVVFEPSDEMAVVPSVAMTQDSSIICPACRTTSPASYAYCQNCRAPLPLGN